MTEDGIGAGHYNVLDVLEDMTNSGETGVADNERGLQDVDNGNTGAMGMSSRI